MVCCVMEKALVDRSLVLASVANVEDGEDWSVATLDVGSAVDDGTVVEAVTPSEEGVEPSDVEVGGARVVAGVFDEEGVGDAPEVEVLKK